MIKDYEKKDSGFICDNISVSDSGELLFAGQSTLSLAEKYGTPLYLFDENKIEEKCDIYVSAVKSAFGDAGQVLYAGKAASFCKVYDIVNRHGLCVDAVSTGEIICALSAGVPPENIYFHSNNKTDGDIADAMDLNIGTFVSDNTEELYAIDREAAKHGKVQEVMLRITPGIDPHTFEAVSTGKVDSKFGFAIQVGSADAAVKEALSLKNIRLSGFHCHVGSQVFSPDVFIATADVMLMFIAGIKKKYGFSPVKLDLGGGIGVPYVSPQPSPDIKGIIADIGRAVKNGCKKYGVDVPVIMLEPGRSVVADAGMTLYTVGSVKRIPDFVNYVSVDGGMTDNVRYAMYGAEYTFLPAGKMLSGKDTFYTVAGRCCESGDILGKNIPLPGDMCRGDILAVCTTGAYNYSMASNYNRIPRPPVVMLKDGESYVAVRRETAKDMLSCDMFSK